MTESEGTLRLMASGRWAVCQPGQDPIEITAADLFHIEFAGKLHLTRMKFRLSGARFSRKSTRGFPQQPLAMVAKARRRRR